MDACFKCIIPVFQVHAALVSIMHIQMTSLSDISVLQHAVFLQGFSVAAAHAGRILNISRPCLRGIPIML